MSAPVLSWDAMLNMTKVELECIHKKVCNVEFITFLRDIGKPTISI